MGGCITTNLKIIRIKAFTLEERYNKIHSNEEFLNLAIRRKIYSKKDQSVPKLNLKSNILYLNRMKISHLELV